MESEKDLRKAVTTIREAIMNDPVIRDGFLASIKVGIKESENFIDMPENILRVLIGGI